MEERRRRKHQAQTRALAVCRDLRRFFGKTPGGRTTVATLKRAVAVQAARHAAQEQCRIDQKMASDRGRKARRFLYVGLRYVSVVSDVVARRHRDSVPAFDKPAWTSDAALIARAEAILGVVSPHEELFVNAGLKRGFLVVLAGEIAALKKAKDDVTRARARFTAATVAFERALEEGKAAITVLDGILLTSKDAPVGVVTALRQAKRIHPRVTEVDDSERVTDVWPPSWLSRFGGELKRALNDVSHEGMCAHQTLSAAGIPARAAPSSSGTHAAADRRDHRAA